MSSVGEETDYKKLYEEETKAHNIAKTQLRFIIEVLGQLPEQFDNIGKGISSLQSQMFTNATTLRNIVQTYQKQQKAEQ